jgi:hypothetical protein
VVALRPLPDNQLDLLPLRLKKLRLHHSFQAAVLSYRAFDKAAGTGFDIHILRFRTRRGWELRKTRCS